MGIWYKVERITIFWDMKIKQKLAPNGINKKVQFFLFGEKQKIKFDHITQRSDHITQNSD